MLNVNAHHLYLNNNNVTAYVTVNDVQYNFILTVTVSVCLLRRTVLEFIERP